MIWRLAFYTWGTSTCTVAERKPPSCTWSSFCQPLGAHKHFPFRVLLLSVFLVAFKAKPKPFRITKGEKGESVHCRFAGSSCWCPRLLPAWECEIVAGVVLLMAACSSLRSLWVGRACSGRGDALGVPGTRLPHPLLPAGRAGLYLSFFLLASGMNRSCRALLLDRLSSPNSLFLWWFLWSLLAKLFCSASLKVESLPS